MLTTDSNSAKAWIDTTFLMSKDLKKKMETVLVNLAFCVLEADKATCGCTLVFCSFVVHERKNETESYTITMLV